MLTRLPLVLNLSDELMLVRGVLFLWTVLLMMGFVDCLFDAIRRRRNCARLLGSIATILLSFLIIALNYTGAVLTSGGFVLGFTIAVLVLLTFGLGLQLGFNFRARRRRIHPGSVKESVDQLSTGVCYYFKDGRIKLQNVMMEKIWRELSGKNLTDGRVLWDAVSGGETLRGTCINSGETPIHILPDGTVRSWQRREVHTDGMELYEVLAADVTEEYSLVRDLEEKEERLRHRSMRLKVIGERIDALNIEKEILDSKIRLHDDWGRALITAKAYIEDPDEEKKREFLSLWNRNISYVEENEQSVAQDAYDDIFNSAKSLGLTIDIDEELPTDYETRNILIQAMAVCIGNMVKHAEGKTLHIQTAHREKTCVYTFTNDGRPPEETVEEKGGLKNLRRKVEAQGGQMSIESTPRFALHIELGERKNGT